ncbi:hypothetical protein BH24ACT5_BH24ACT5_26890 [soil metagenome]
MMDDPALLALFASQHGVASIAQLRAGGVARRTVTRAIDRRTLHHVLPRVVLLHGYPLSFHARSMAALLHCGDGALLDGAAAGSLHGLRAMPSSVVTVTVARRTSLAMPGWIERSWSQRIDPSDRVKHPSGLLVAHPHRMLFSLAGTLRVKPFERAAEDAWHLQLLTPATMADYVAHVRGRGVAGVAALDLWLAQALPRPRPSQSGLELDALEAVRRAGLPEPVRQYPLVLGGGQRIHLDLAWPDRRLAIEPGHSWWHGGNQRMRADYARDRACGEHGWQVVRFDETMHHDLDDAARQLKLIHDARIGHDFAP